jgi:DNA-binding CsgD family transcriptional regulator
LAEFALIFRISLTAHGDFGHFGLDSCHAHASSIYRQTSSQSAIWLPGSMHLKSVSSDFGAGGAIAQLTEAQLECLQLVRRRRTAKQIARSLGITHHAVEQRLKSARRKLGVDTTAEAVDLLEAAEREAYGDTVYGLPDVANMDADWPPQPLSPPYGGDSGKEVLTAFSPAMGDAPTKAPSAFEKLTWAFVGDASTMSWKHRVVFMSVTALATLMTVILLVSFIEGLSRLGS